MMRAQYHFRKSPDGLRAWNVHRLVELSRSFPRERVPLSSITELEEPYWANENTRQLTCREIVGHARLMLDCDLAFPISDRGLRPSFSAHVCGFPARGATNTRVCGFH
jgi:hypothetical protein